MEYVEIKEISSNILERRIYDLASETDLKRLEPYRDKTVEEVSRLLKSIRKGKYVKLKYEVESDHETTYIKQAIKIERYIGNYTVKKAYLTEESILLLVLEENESSGNIVLAEFKIYYRAGELTFKEENYSIYIVPVYSCFMEWKVSSICDGYIQRKNYPFDMGDNIYPKRRISITPNEWNNILKELSTRLGNTVIKPINGKVEYYYKGGKIDKKLVNKICSENGIKEIIIPDDRLLDEVFEILPCDEGQISIRNKRKAHFPIVWDYKEKYIEEAVIIRHKESGVEILGVKKIATPLMPEIVDISKIPLGRWKFRVSMR